MSAELDSLRAEIDALDRELVALLNRRASIALAAGKAKTSQGRPIADADREREVLLRVAMANQGPLPQDALLGLYRALIETIKRLEESDKDGHRPA
jgi:chorismate mutase/prephenate dehydratase